ncbi:MAG TPA: heterodisulfide reductase-related iron-sulfur binding cluster [Desulfomonilaceae bacterium]|nr:heterodisulfide reductase-related iron-sulfur binding cluster [Desulfomonilaceae bacterium]
MNRFFFWRSGRPLARWDNPGQRLVALFWATVGQRRVFRRPGVGFSHYFVFLGVLVPGLIILAVQFDPPVPEFAAGLASLFLEVVGLALLAGVVYALVRRFQPLPASPSTGFAGLAVLVMLVLIVFTGFLTEGFRISIAPESDVWRHPVGWALALVLPPSPVAIAITWYVHFGLVFALLAAMPFSPLRHIVTAPLNLFFRDLGPAGKLEPCRMNSEEALGITAAEDLTWKDLLDADACVACGQCRDSCPAYASQKPLSPMKIIQEIRTCALEMRRNGGASRGELLSRYVSEEEIWACTSCHACQNSCPVGVEHVGKLMNLRRGLVLEQGKVPQEAIKPLRNLDVYGDPYGYGPASRTMWANSLEKNLFESGEKEGQLFWVGCQASFHPRAREVATAFMTLAGRAGQRMAILGSQETCCGDPARRLGEEALFQQLARRNMERFKELGVKSIVTLCPHCFNTFAHEYRDFGARFTVLHAVEWAASLLHTGRLKPKRLFSGQFTYHDPCYLSRVNSLAHFPRAILELVCHSRLKEMPSTGDETFCCGAGGGRIWLHETGSRINVLRAKQCAETEAEVVSTSCPYCVAMLEDGLTEVHSGPQRVLDVIEIVELATR